MFIWHSLYIEQPGEFFIYKFIWHSLEIQHYSLIILHIEEIHHAFDIQARVRKLSCYFFLGSFDIFKCSTFGMITYIDVYLTFIRDSTAQIIVHINVHLTFLRDPTIWIIIYQWVHLTFIRDSTVWMIILVYITFVRDSTVYIFSCLGLFDIR